MTKKHLERAAELVREFRAVHLGHVGDGVAECIEDAFVEFFETDNPDFDTDGFRKSCKVK